jgi:hypothetical protein
VVRGSLKAPALTRAKNSPPFAKALAKHFPRMGAVPGKTDRLLQRARETGMHPLDVAFDADVAAFVWDDENGNWVDSIYLDPETGYFDALAPVDTPVSVWVGTYDDLTEEATIVAPMTYGYNYEFPPDDGDVIWDYDGYFWAPPAEVVVENDYVISADDQRGYYEIDWGYGRGYFYLLPDQPAYGSYYMIWDDGLCSQGFQVYIAFDGTGRYFSMNGVDGPMSLSGQASAAEIGYLSGTGRWTVTGEDGLNYQVEVTLSYLGEAPAIGNLCPAAEIELPPDVSGCPPGCVYDSGFNICVISGTLDPVTMVGLSCDLYDDLGAVIECPDYCAMDDSGFCWDTDGYICY